jgi:uncharacterized membrane protein
MIKLKRGTLYTVLKTALYRVIGVSANYALLYTILGNAGQAGKIAIYTLILHTVLYFVYERVSVVVEEKIFYKKDET